MTKVKSPDKRQQTLPLSHCTPKRSWCPDLWPWRVERDTTVYQERGRLTEETQERSKFTEPNWRAWWKHTRIKPWYEHFTSLNHGADLLWSLSIDDLSRHSSRTHSWGQVLVQHRPLCLQSCETNRRPPEVKLDLLLALWLVHWPNNQN